MEGVLPSGRTRLGQGQRRAQTAIGIVRSVGQDHDRRLQAFRPVDRHHPHQPAAALGLALQLAVARIEPVEEPGQAGGLAGAIAVGGVEQFVERIVRLAPQPRHQLAPRLPGPDQQPVQQGLGHVVIGPGQQPDQLAHGRGHQRLARSAQVLPQGHAGGPVAMGQQVLLRPADQG